jgi:mRNA interferase MazF
MVDKISTMPRSKLGIRIGRLDSLDLAALDRAVIVFLGLAG